MKPEIIAKIKKCMKVAEKALGKEPAIFIDNKGNYWLNHFAKEFLLQNNIQLKDFMEWLMIGSSHLQHISYGTVRVRMMELPGGHVVAFLRHGLPTPGLENIKLTFREKEILGCLIRGFSNKKIATVMKISPGTVNTHLDNIYGKLGCSNRHEASFIALRSGLFLPPKSV